MILLIGLTGCQTVPEIESVEIPEFSARPPVRPVLETIPSDVQGAIKTLTVNMSKLANLVEEWEMYSQMKDAYYKTVLDILGQ